MSVKRTPKPCVLCGRRTTHDFGAISPNRLAYSAPMCDNHRYDPDFLNSADAAVERILDKLGIRVGIVELDNRTQTG